MSSSSHRSSALQQADWLTGPEEGGNAEPRKSGSIAEEIMPQIKPVRSTLGLNPNPPVDEQHLEQEQAKLRWGRIRIILREPFAEFWGTFILVLFGCGSIAQVLLSAGLTNAPGRNGFGEYQSINWGWAIGLMLGVYVAGDSGGYLNPAVTLTNCLFRKLPWKRFPIYFLAQFLGGFIGAGVVYANYVAAIDNFEGHGVRTVPPSSTATAGIFATYPQGFLPTGSMFVSEFIGSAVLMFVIFALKDESNIGAGKLFPLGLFFLLFGLGAAFGYETGYALNFARDFGPRLMTYALGYGPEVWSSNRYYFWIPMVAPFPGCIFGGFLYDIFIYTGESPATTFVTTFIEPNRALGKSRDSSGDQA
ncbi:MAG: hypothetical protein Q9187_005793 [Circinaria calcarea]